MQSDWTLPDPQRQPEFYADVPIKRALAFIVDTVILLAAALVLVLLTFGLALFVLVPVWGALNIAYRALTLARYSATPGMRLMAIEFRDASGARLSSETAALHTLGLVFSFVFLPVQVVSAVLMATGPRGQGLTDMVLGTVALNRRATA